MLSLSIDSFIAVIVRNATDSVLSLLMTLNLKPVTYSVTIAHSRDANDVR